MKHIHKILENGGRPLDVDVCDSNEFYLQLAYQLQSEERVRHLVSRSWQGFQSGFSPKLCESGVGGTYFMHDAHNRLVGVFKPQDEEMGCLNNPKGFTPQEHYMDCSMKRGVRGGEAAFRECAAYILDHDHFSGVPATDLVICNYPSFRHNSPPSSPIAEDENIKIGSFQEYKDHDFDAEDISPVKAALFPVKEVHKIAILDIRMVNTDRHGGNILIRESSSSLSHSSDIDYSSDEGSCTQFHMEFESDDEDFVPRPSAGVVYELIPIDHGYTLPHSLAGLSDSRFEWLNWPQSKVTFDSKTCEYIASLDPHKDIALLKERFPDRFPQESFNVLIIATLWLKTAARHGLSAFEIGCAMCRPQPEELSKLEKMLLQVHEIVGADGASSPESCPIDDEFEQMLIRVMENAINLPKCAVLVDSQGMVPKMRMHGEMVRRGNFKIL